MSHTPCCILLSLIMHMSLKLIEVPDIDFPSAFWKKMKGENLPLPAAGEILYVPVDSLAVLPKLFATPPSDIKYVYLPGL